MNKIKKYFRVFKRYRGRFGEFIIDSVAGLLSGTIIGVFFSLIASITFNRWINLGNYEFFAAIIYVFFTLCILWFFYWLGMFIAKFIFKSKKLLIGFHLNMIAGVFSSMISFLVVLYHNFFWIDVTILGLWVIISILLAHWAIKKKF
jgi:hypothetical protein